MPAHPLLDALRPCLARTPGKPIVAHLNADTTWLVLLPIPHPRPMSKRYYKLLVDPWLTGYQVDYFPWFSKQRHVIQSSVQTIAELEGVLCELEDIERSSSESEALDVEDGQNPSLKDCLETSGSRSAVDAVLVLHEFTDHCHKTTLLQLPPSTPVVAAPGPANRIRSWKHFDVVDIIPRLSSCIDEKEDDSDWRTTAHAHTPHLPPWISASLLFKTFDSYHTGLLLVFSPPTDGLPPNAILYSPHGVPLPALFPLVTLMTPLVHIPSPSPTTTATPVHPPNLTILALLHGLDELQLGFNPLHLLRPSHLLRPDPTTTTPTHFALSLSIMSLNLGARHGGAAARALRARVWVGTHEEAKEARGIVARILQRRRGAVPVGEVVAGEEGEGTKYVELGSGECLVLDI